MRTIIINSSNYVSGTNNTFLYTLPSSTKFNAGDTVGVASIAIYNSTFNITSARGNNTIQIIWNAPNPVTALTYTLTFPDGYYSVSDINFFIQSFCITNNLYMTDTNGDNVYFVELVTNAPRYSVQLNCYALPTTAQATTLGYSIPSGATWTAPATASTPQLVLSNTFSLLIGFATGTFPSSIQTTTQTSLSTTVPVISPIDSYNITCNLINSPLSIPNNTFFSLPLTVGLGSLITLSPAQIVFNDIAPNVYNQILVKFYDQLFNELKLNDFQVTLTLAIKNSTEL